MTSLSYRAGGRRLNPFALSSVEGRERWAVPRRSETQRRPEVRVGCSSFDKALATASRLRRQDERVDTFRIIEYWTKALSTQRNNH